MRLSELIADLDGASVSADAEIAGLSYDSRAVAPGDLFFCVKGFVADGHDHAAAAVASGASALVCERTLAVGVPEVVVSDARQAMPPIASRFHGDPTGRLSVVGITGTNGKTTTAYLVRAILEAVGTRCGLLGTVERIVGGVRAEAVRTTPEAVDLQATFAAMLAGGDEACAMEVSSHALELGRVEGTRFAVAAFTNLSRDHLDFHPDMEAYFDAKRRLFEPGRSARSVVNVDDPYGARLAGELGEGCITVSVDGAEAEFRAGAIDFDASGSRFEAATPAGRVAVSVGLPGRFNVENALVSIAIAHALGVDAAEAAAALAGAPAVPGRLEPIRNELGVAVLVDYAHTPDSLENVLRAARRMTEGRLICVFGCGGDRDKEKRPLMGRAAAVEADVPIVTSDNPRSEEPEAIIDQILEGMERDDVEVVVGRREAIARAIAIAEPGDTVLIAGKGHEQGQELAGGQRVPFDDREVARQALTATAAGGA